LTISTGLIFGTQVRFPTDSKSSPEKLSALPSFTEAAQVGCLRSSGFGSGSWRRACLEHPVGSHDEPIKICRPRWLVDRAGSRSEHFHTRMERGIAWRRSGRLGLEALRSAIPPDGRAGERHLAMGLHRAARQWPPLRRSRPESIAAFAVDPETGHLTAAEHTPTEAVPSAFCLDPAGHFLFAASTASGRLASYRINQQSGALTPLALAKSGR